MLRDALRHNSHLAELSAGGLPLPPAAAAILGEIVAASTSLTALCAGDAATGDESITAFAPGLARSRALQKLDLGNRAFGPPGAAALARALTSGGLANGGAPPAALPAAAGFPSLHTLILAGEVPDIFLTLLSLQRIRLQNCLAVSPHQRCPQVLRHLGLRVGYQHVQNSVLAHRLLLPYTYLLSTSGLRRQKTEAWGMPARRRWRRRRWCCRR